LIKLGSVRINAKEDTTPPPSKILTTATLLPATADLISGSTQQLIAKAADQNGADFNDAVFNFSSDSPNVATIDTNGLVTAVSAGTAIITVFANANGVVVTASSSVSVSNPVQVPEPEPEPELQPEPQAQDFNQNSETSDTPNSNIDADSSGQ
jgi:uncharacterized protein YjdB